MFFQVERNPGVTHLAPQRFDAKVQQQADQAQDRDKAKKPDRVAGEMPMI